MIIPEELKPGLQGVFPSTIATCSPDGIPNVSYVSQVYDYDENHVALSDQFFNKTIKNVRANPLASVLLTHPETMESYVLEVEYKHSENEGPFFEEMEMKLEAIASMTGMSGVFKLRGADIYKVLSITKNQGDRKK
jgi:hypothetical protein